MTLAILPLARADDSAVRLRLNALPVPHVVRVGADVLVAVRPRVGTLAMLFGIYPVADVLGAVRVGAGALPVRLAVLELADVLVAVRKGQLTRRHGRGRRRRRRDRHLGDVCRDVVLRRPDAVGAHVLLHQLEELRQVRLPVVLEEALVQRRQPVAELRLDEPVDLTVTIGADWEIP